MLHQVIEDAEINVLLEATRSLVCPSCRAPRVTTPSEPFTSPACNAPLVISLFVFPGRDLEVPRELRGSLRGGGTHGSIICRARCLKPSQPFSRPALGAIH